MFLTLIVFHTERGYFLSIECRIVSYKHIVCTIAKGRKFYDTGGKIIGVVVFIFITSTEAYAQQTQ